MLKSKISRKLVQLFTIKKIIFPIAFALVTVTTSNNIFQLNINLFILFIIFLTSWYLISSYFKSPPKLVTLLGVKPPHWVISLSIFISLSVVYNIYLNSTFLLDNFSQRTIGILVLEGISAIKRSSIYIYMIFVFIAFLSLSIYLYSQINLIVFKHLKPKITKNEKDFIFAFSSISIFIFVLHLMSGLKSYIDIFNFLGIFIFLAFSNLFMKIYLLKENKIAFKLLNNYDLNIFNYLSPFVILIIWQVFTEKNYAFPNKLLVLYIPLWILFWLASYFATKFFSKHQPNKVINAILFGGIPFLLIPISMPLSNELQFSLSNTLLIPARAMIAISIFLLSLVSLFIFYKNLLKKQVKTKYKIAEYFFFPILISTAVMFGMHINYINISDRFDLFHHGENLISTQQLFSFNKIPFFDIFPTHGISYMTSQTLYSLINGYKPFEPWLWEWIVKIFEITLFYFVFKKTTAPLLSTMIIIFLPILAIFGGDRFLYGYNTSFATTYYFTIFLACLSFSQLMKEFSYKKLFVHWGVCIFLTLWRIDFGIASILSTFLILAAIRFTEKLSSFSINIRQTTISFIKSFALVLVLFIVLSSLNNKSPIQIFLQILEFVRSQASSQGLENIATPITPLAVFQYLLLPMIGIFYILVFANNIIKKRLNKFTDFQWVLIYLAFFSLIISTRSVQRQTLSVLGYNPYFFIFLLFCIPFYLNRYKKHYSYIFFLFSLLAYQFAFPKYIQLIKSGSAVEPPHTWVNKESRVRGSFPLENVTSFINSNLNNQETFLDLTSSPTLYVTTNKEFINYFIPSTYLSSDSIQKYSLNRLKQVYNKGRIPLIIFRQPDSFANNIDGVPNEIRSYRIFEFIYQNYHPSVSVNGYEFWTANDFELKHKDDAIENKYIEQNFDLKMLPYIWAKYDPLKSVQKTKILSTLISKPTKVSPGKSVNLLIDEGIDKTKGNYLYLKIRSKRPGNVKLVISENPVSQISFDINGSETDQEYMIRISSLYEWYQNIVLIKFHSSDNVTLYNANIRSGD